MSGHRLGLAAAAAVVGLSCIAAPLALSRAEAREGPPKNARPGECYGKVILPPLYSATQATVVKRAAWTETRHGKPVIERTRRQVLVRAARVERTRTAAVYRTEVSWIERAGPRQWVSEPAQYEIVREKVMVEPGHAEWRRQSAPLAYGESAYGPTRLEPTGEVVCRVWIPARYGFTERKVMVSKGRSYSVAGPVRHEKIVRKVLVRPGGWTERRIPALYKTVVSERFVRPGVERTIQHPATYERVARRKVIREEGPGWAKVLCGGAINPAFMARVQEALIDRGFDPGPPDGVGRPQTYAAMRIFQRQHGLAQGQLTEETARALGVL